MKDVVTGLGASCTVNTTLSVLETIREPTLHRSTGTRSAVQGLTLSRSRYTKASCPHSATLDSARRASSASWESRSIRLTMLSVGRAVGSSLS